MRNVDRETRRALGCGYEPPLDGARPWDHEGRIQHADELDQEDGHDLLPVCPGYVCGLPETIEVTRVRLHAKMNTVTNLLAGAPLPDPLAFALEQLEAESQRAEQWAMEHPPERKER